MHRFWFWLSEWWVRILLVLLVLTPYLWWQLAPAQPVSVLIIDKTVPKQDWREHLGLTWLLNHRKFTRPAGGLYDPERDYYGYHPGEARGDEQLLPPEDPDLIYIADTYGVFSQDQAENPRGERSQLLYGGLKAAEWDRIWDARSTRTTLIVEFNSFASPTDAQARSRVERDLKIAWTGWTGRHFSDLASVEVPLWLVQNFEKQYKTPWSFKGAGVAFVDESDRVLILAGDEVRGLVMFTPTADGLARYPALQPVAYPYWFDMITPASSLVVEAEYQLGVSEQGAAKLKALGLPTRFPAVIASRDARTFYFAGDYADKAEKTIFRFKGIRWFKSTFATAPEDLFYWRVYVPMMDVILSDVAAQR